MSSDIDRQPTEANHGTSSHQDAASSHVPPLPVLPDEDMDDDDENFPLITSVFSLASSNGDSTYTSEAESPRKTPSPGKTKDPTSPKELFSTKTSAESPEEMTPLTSSEVKATSPSSSIGMNVPFYVGKGKLVLSRSDENKGRLPGMTFNRIVNVTSTTSATSITNTMMTRGALKKVTCYGQDIGSKTVSPSQTDVGAASSNLTSGNLNGSKSLTTGTSSSTVTLPLTNVNPARTQIAAPATSSIAVNVQQAVKPVVQVVQQSASSTNVQNPLSTPVGTAVVQKSVVNPVLQNPVSTQVRPAGPQILSTPALSPGMISVRARLPVAKQRHVNIAPAPATSTPQFVIVPKTAATTTATSSQATATNSSTSGQARVVMLPKQNSPTPGQLMYLIENKTADGKTFRFLIPTDSAKIMTSPAGAQSPVITTRPAQTTTSPVTSPTQVIRIIPKVPGVTAPLSKPTTPVSKPTTPVVLKVSPTQSAVTASVGATAAPVKSSTSAVLNIASPTPGNITPPGSTSPTVDISSPTSEEDPMNTPPDSPSTVEDPAPKTETIDAGLSPHEARIQKLKELLRKQEDAVDKLREKRKKEIDDARSSATVTDSKDDRGAGDSPFAVPLPPKRPRLDAQSKQNKIKDTSSQTSKDGFLPNSDDTQFSKLLGLEKVVDKIKAKKIRELNQNKATELK